MLKCYVFKPDGGEHQCAWATIWALASAHRIALEYPQQPVCTPRLSLNAIADWYQMEKDDQYDKPTEAETYFTSVEELQLGLTCVTSRPCDRPVLLIDWSSAIAPAEDGDKSELDRPALGFYNGVVPALQLWSQRNPTG